MQKILTSTIVYLACIGTLSAQCNFLAYDGFDYPVDQPLQGQQGGAGWDEPWHVQNANTNVPGYQMAGTTSLTWLDLQSIGQYASGGQAYLTSGRGFNLSQSGPFATWLNNEGAIGEPGTTLWFSVLLRKSEQNDEPVRATLHESNLQWCEDCSTKRVSVGYFGSPSNVGGQRRWGMRIGSTHYTSTVPVVAGETVFLVLKLEFQVTGTAVSLYVNPPALGASTPTPTLTETTSTLLQIRTLALYLGDNPNSGQADEVRVGATYQCVAPDPATAINFPPVAAFNVSPTTGMAPLAVSLDGTSSNDPDGTIVNYSWNFGDGSPGATGAVVSHTFTATGVLTVMLTVTDDDGLQHTFQRTITVLNQYGTYTCQLGLVNERLANCAGQGSRFSVNNYQNATLQLRNPAGSLLPPSASNSNVYENIPVGTYSLTAAGTDGCRDTFEVHIQRDSSTCPEWKPNPCDMRIGVGIEGLAYYTQSRPFKDYFKSSGTWITYDPNPPGGNFIWNTENQQYIPTDADGYPTVVPFTVPNGSGQNLIRGIMSALGFIPVGVPMRLLYDGTGTLQMQGDISVSSSVPGQIDFTATGDGNIFFNLTSSQSSDHVRNIRVVEVANLATYQSQPFRQGFLDKAVPFNTLRFMDWMHTNGSDQVQWANRTRPTYYSQAESPNGGLAYEYIIQVANLLDKNIWICIPHQADDDYISQMATMFRDQLEPKIKVYIEYSNETWNWIFEQAHWVADNGPQNISYPRRYAARATHAFDIWMQVWGTQNNRIKRVLATQSGYDWVTEEIMAHADQDSYDYISPSWYVGLDHGPTGVPNLQALGAAATPQDVLDNANHVFETFYPRWQMVYRTAKLYNKGVVNYEGGQHFTDFSVPPYIQSMYEAQVLPGMYNLYDRMLDSLRVLGSEMPMAFVLTGPWQSIYGSWGHIFDEDDPAPWTDRPKYQVLLDQIGLCLTSSLPVELSDFTAKCVPSGTMLRWSAHAEARMAFYDVEISDDGSQWQSAGRVTPRGVGHQYQVALSGAAARTKYYRLAIHDNDGSISYAPLITNPCQLAGTVRIYPNPTTGLLLMDIPTQWEPARYQVRVYDARGQVQMDQNLTEPQIQLPTHLSSGLYFVEVLSDSGVVVANQRIMKEAE